MFFRIFCLLLFLQLKLWGQHQQLAVDIVQNNLVKIPAYELPSGSVSYKLLTMPFGSSKWLDTSGVSELAEADILAVDLLFTEYPAHLDLRPLNTSRFEALFSLLPHLVVAPYVRYAVVRQMAGNTKATAAGMLHGFVITYRNAASPDDAIAEINSLKAAIPPLPKDSLKPPPQPNPKIRHWDYKYKPLTNPPDPTKEELRNPPENYKPPSLKDSVFYKGLKRLNYNNMIAVADVTCSMSPYNMDLLLWLQNPDNNKRIKWLVCFNDGDGKADNEKKIGKAGGIYTESFTTIQAAGFLMSKAKRFCGGDFAENDVEALLAAQKLGNSNDELVLLADSWAPVRDIELANAIKKPVHVFAMGGNLGIHPDYVTIALLSGGSIHFLNEDITDFSPLLAGKIMTIRGRPYVWDGKKVSWK